MVETRNIRAEWRGPRTVALYTQTDETNNRVIASTCGAAARKASGGRRVLLVSSGGSNRPGERPEYQRVYTVACGVCGEFGCADESHNVMRLPAVEPKPASDYYYTHIGRAFSNEHNGRRDVWSIGGVREANGRSELFVRYTGHMEGTTFVGLPLGGPHWTPPSYLWIPAEGFHWFTFFQQ